MSFEESSYAKRRKKTVLDVNKLLDINANYHKELKKRAYHRVLDIEDLRINNRFERRLYRRVRNERKKADSARAKWKGLRDTFRGELRKVNKTIANGTPCNSTNWEYFNEMMFVKDQIYSNRRSLADVMQQQQRTTIPATDSSVDEGNESVDIADLCKQEVVEGEEEIDPQAVSCEEASSPPPTPRVGLLMLDDSAAPEAPIPHVHPTDDDYNFLMSILPQLRSLPTMRNLYVRLKIQELLYSEIVSLQESN